MLCTSQDRRISMHSRLLPLLALLFISTFSQYSHSQPNYNWTPVSVSYGLPDAKATVGRVFKYTISKDAFAGDITKYQVNEAGSSDIPSWMYFNDASNTIEGIPTHEDVHQYYISVTAYGHSHNNTYTSKAVDVFSIDVVNGPSIESSSAATPLNEYSKNGKVKCTDGEPEALATIILDANWSKMTPKHRVHSVERMAEYSGFSKNLFKLLPAGKDGLFNSNALVAGPGNIKHQNYPGILLSWPVGCGYDVNKLPVVMVIESTAKDGGLAKNIGHNVIGWHISHPQQKRSKRMKRQIAAMATIVPTLLPTQISPTSTTDVGGMESTAIPSGRVVPSETSPVMSEVIRTKISPTKSIMPSVKPTDTKVRTPSASPTKKMTSKTKTPGLMTAMPTPTPAPPLPTKAVTEGPSRTYSPPMPSVAETEALSTIPAMTSTPMTSSSAVMPSQLPPSAVIEPSRTYISQTDEPTQIVVTPTPVPTTLELTTTSEPLKPQITTGKTPLTTTSTVVKPNKVPLVRNPPIMPEIITGKVFKYQIPQNTFYDEEDGDTFNLKLVFTTSDGMPVPSDSWIQFNTNLQTLIGLPMKTDARQNNKYILTAVDSGGKIAIVPMDLDVTLSSLKKNHEFKISLVDGSKDLDNKVTTKVDIIERLATLYEDPTTDFISVSSFDKDSWTLGWSNNTQRYDPCPRKKIKLLTKVIEKMKGTPGVPSQALKEAMRPEYVVTRVEDTPFGPCTEEEIATTKAPPRIVSPVPTLTPNTAPILLNHIDRVVVYDGETFSYQIPQDTFYDAEDGVTPNLKLIFLTIEGVMMHKASWVQFNVTSQTLYGIPINRVGKYEYIMGAMDSGAKIARDAFEIEVVMNPHKPNYEFSVTLSNDITEFENDVFKTMDLVGRIAMLYGDDSNDAITVAYMKKGSTILGWSNNTMIYEPCPIEAIGKLAKLLETDKHQPTEIFINTLAPEYEVLSVSTSPIGPCVSPNKGTEAPEGPGIAESSGLTSDEEIWVITVVPALIVAAVLLLAGLIIFLCYRYSRKGKLSDEDEDTFIHKGVPVIFTDEMDDAEKPPSSASPLIMREEVPPVPPPEYPRQGSPSSNHPLLAHSFEDNADLDDTFFYQPPSGLSSTPDSRRSTPRNLRAYRPPPPYVPP